VSFFRPEANQGRRTFPSRNKFIPYLTVHCARTEQWDDTGTTITATVTASAPATLTFCQYLDTLSIDYLYHMNSEFTSLNTIALNAGTAADGTASMVNAYSGYGLSASSTGVAINSCDTNIGVKYLGGHAGGATGVAFRLPIGISAGAGTIVAGGWYNLQNDVGSTLFQSNMGGTSGYQRGVYMFVNGSGAIEVWYGNNLGSSQVTHTRRYKTANSVFTFNAAKMVALKTQTVTDPSLVAHTLWVDAVETSLSFYSGSAAVIAWPTGVNQGVGWPGTSDIRSDDPSGVYDELFLKLGDLTLSHIQTMWTKSGA